MFSVNRDWGKRLIGEMRLGSYFFMVEIANEEELLDFRGLTTLGGFLPGTSGNHPASRSTLLGRKERAVLTGVGF